MKGSSCGSIGNALLENGTKTAERCQKDHQNHLTNKANVSVFKRSKINRGELPRHCGWPPPKLYTVSNGIVFSY